KQTYRPKNRVESPGIKPCIYGPPIFSKNTRWSKDSIVSSTNGDGELNVHTQKNETGPLSYTTYKKQTTYSKNLYVRPEILKLLQKKHGRKLHDIGFGKDFIDKAPKAQATKAKADKWDYINLKCPAQQRKQPTQQKDNLQNGRKYLQTMYLIRGNSLNT
uniref:Lymphocyte expansion molecule n=1 Tax=Felis catus TaxID=9685 RepID=A0ABI7YXP9_FELCA